MQFVTAIEPGSSGIPTEVIQGVEFANPKEALLLISQLGAYACHEIEVAARKTPKDVSEDAKRARELAALVCLELGDASSGEYPRIFPLRNLELRVGGYRSTIERKAHGAVLHKLAWHHNIPIVSSPH